MSFSQKMKMFLTILTFFSVLFKLSTMKFVKSHSCLNVSSLVLILDFVILFSYLIFDITVPWILIDLFSMQFVWNLTLTTSIVPISCINHFQTSVGSILFYKQNILILFSDHKNWDIAYLVLCEYILPKAIHWCKIYKMQQLLNYTWTLCLITFNNLMLNV